MHSKIERVNAPLVDSSWGAVLIPREGEIKC